MDLAIDGLRTEGFDVEEFIGASEAEARALLQAAVTDVDDALPVIVTLQNIILNPDGDHAVVVTDVRQADIEDAEREMIEFTDPATGTVERDDTGRFWQQWSFAGRRAFIIRL